MTPRDEIARLTQVDFPSAYELVARVLVLITAAGLLAFYQGTYTAFAWIGVYFSVLGAYWFFLKSRAREPTHRDVQSAKCLFLALLLAFIWFPALAMTRHEVPVAFTAAAGWICLLVFLVWRAETSLVHIAAQIAALLVAHLVVLQHYVGHVDTLSHQAIMAVTALAPIAYLAQAMLATRARERRAARSAIRSAQAQKYEAVGQLAGGIAHEFNNVLTALQGNLELAQMVSDEGERRQLIDDAHASSLRAANLVRQLLAYARAGRMKSKRTSLGRLLDVVEQSARNVLPAAIRLKLDRPRPDLTLDTDAEALVAVLLQLIANARDAMPNGGSIEISAESRCESRSMLLTDGTILPPGHYLRIVVADNGQGIPDDIIGRVSDPFFTTKPVGMGSGMGLAAATGFARQSGGGLRIQSSPSGTRMTLLLPGTGADPDCPRKARATGVLQPLK